MDFRVPEETQALLEDLDEFIESEIEPLEDDHPEFFDHRREAARTNWDDGTPSAEWLALLDEMRERAEAAGFYRLLLPEDLGGEGASNLTMAIVREHLAARGPGLHNVIQVEESVVGNHGAARLVHRYGNEAQKERYLEGMLAGEIVGAFGLTEPAHGSDATHMDTTAEKDGDGWVIDGRKRWITGMDRADVVQIFARTSGDDGDHEGITGFLVPTDTEGLEVPYFHWTFNMPTDHAEIELDSVRVPDSAVVGEEGAGLRQAQDFVHEGRIRQAAASVGAAQFCIDEAASYARERETWGTELAQRQGIQFPLADYHIEAELVRNLVRKTAWMLDQRDQLAVSDKVSMANYRANRLACDAADWAMQVHGGMGYSRAKPFEHIYRHHRRYRITEGTEQVQLRNVAGHLFGYIG
jgi:alkylation response protein AidB-like acyl-CoA dehydrogenase